MNDFLMPKLGADVRIGGSVGTHAFRYRGRHGSFQSRYSPLLSQHYHRSQEVVGLADAAEQSAQGHGPTSLRRPAIEGHRDCLARGIDSMDFLNFVIGLHEELQVDIPERDYGLLASLDGCVNYLKSGLAMTQ